MSTLIKPGLIFSFILMMISAPVSASGGIALGATRVIYPADAKQTSLAITNSNKQERYLVNAWIENDRGQKEKTFAVTPPLFVSEPDSENTLRIIYAGPPLPSDRESLFFMNVKAIPSVNKENMEGKNVLQLAILSRIKLFVRPKNLAMPPEEALSQLRFERAGNYLKVSNASPYYVTLVNLQLGGQKLENIMIAPKNSAQQALPTGASGALSWQSVNDYGAITPARRVSL
ncbi:MULTISPECIES: type 1 fimbria chaperone FimC [Lelliottia]|uniref:Molecular chaperone FimC n=1 Tax=Lelliottia aquatilis TaxID=2080838 RepID=A0ABX5A1B0_9ENTR|nr:MULTISPECIES: type 1 fimbria chaperone FimC [Lelliottia]NTZ46224.1 type 1 fimbriae chaperone FimC [Lelliottia aquatilis]POZ22833.1 molecular chaperone FimC [Lelliottia aquatilis]POZ25469.1 molecular chaperone FimC [Lelliottia sp. 7254-16]POZ26408.1 molecular chaperone FimC [Lelliottia aquatilis]POZ32396.1 molecular chaperone FimC [Lelliottia aquatilis]